MNKDPGFAPEDVWELGDIVAGAFLVGMIPGTGRFSRALLGAGYRRVAEPIPELEVPDPDIRAVHWLEVGPSVDHALMFEWACSCRQESTMVFGELAGAFQDAVEHVPADQTWRAQPSG